MDTTSFPDSVRTGPSFIHELTLAVEREKPDAILIGSDVEPPVVAAHRAQLERDFDVQVVVSSPEMVGSPTTSTAPTSSWSSIGSTPLTCLAGEEDALLAKVGYPVVVKPRHGARSVGMSVAATGPHSTGRSPRRRRRW